MTASATYAYAPEIAEFGDEAFERCGIDPAVLTMRHNRSARRSLNLLFAEWATKGDVGFLIDEQTQTVTTALATYTATTGTLAMFDVTVRRSSTDTPVFPMNRDEYAGIPDKTSQGLPSRVFFDRAAGTYKLWNVPENSTDQIRYWRLRRVQDASAGSQTPDVPYYWFEALASGLASKLAIKFAPGRLSILKAEANEKFQDAKYFDRERGDTTFSVGGRG